MNPYRINALTRRDIGCVWRFLLEVRSETERTREEVVDHLQDAWKTWRSGQQDKDSDAMDERYRLRDVIANIEPLPAKSELCLDDPASLLGMPPEQVWEIMKDDGGDIDRWKRLSEEYFGIDEHDYPVMVQKARHLMYLFGMLMGAER